MIVFIATGLAITVIVGMFALDRNHRGERTSEGLWVPVMWLLLAGSRNVSEWMAPSNLAAFSTDRYLEGSPLDRNIQIGLLALGLTVLIQRRQRIGAVLRANIPIIVFISYCLLSISWSDFPDVAFKRWTKLVGDLIMVIIVLTDRDPVLAIKRLLKRAGFLLVPLSILFIRYYPEWGRHYTRWEGAVSYTGVTTDKNTLGMVCMVIGLGAVWRFVTTLRSNERKRRKIGPLVTQGALGIMVMGLLQSVNSATASSCFMLGSILIIATIFLKAAKRATTVWWLSIVILAIPFSALFLNIGTSGLVEDLGRNSTLTGRTILWQAVLTTTKSPIIGSGYESFWLGNRVEQVASITGQHPNEAHNGYLEIYANLGWIGVSLLGIIILSNYRKIVAGFRSDPEMGGLKLAYFISALSYNFTEAAFKMTHPVWILFLWAIVVIPKGRTKTFTKMSKTKPEGVSLPVPQSLVETSGAYKSAGLLG